MNRPRVLRPERADSIYRPALLDLRARARVVSAWPGSTRRDAARCSVLDEKSVSHDNRVQRSDNAYIIVGAFPLALWGEKSVRAIQRYTKMTAEFNIMQ